MNMQKINIIILLLSLFLVIGCQQKLDCPSANGQNIRYVDVSTFDLNLSQDRSFILNQTILDLIDQSSVADCFWMNANCKSRSIYTIYVNNTEMEVSKDEYDNFIKIYNTSCHGCVKIIEMRRFV